MNFPPGDTIDKIDPQATDFYRLFDEAYKQIQTNQFPGAIATLRQAIAANPDDSLSHYVLATALSATEQEADALTEYRKAANLIPTFPDHLAAVSLALSGDSEAALGQLETAVSVDPGSVEHRFNLAYVFESRSDFAAAISQLEKAAALSRSKDWRCLAELAKVYDKTGRTADADALARQALDLAVKQDNQQVAHSLQRALGHYAHGGSRRTPQFACSAAVKNFSLCGMQTVSPSRHLPLLNIPKPKSLRLIQAMKTSGR